MEYRLNKRTLLEILGQWNGFIKRKVHFIACGGTALTLLDIKPSTKDIDFMVPNETEYRYLIRILKDLGYQQITGSGWQRKGDLFIFDLFPGKRIHVIELIESPLKEGNHIILKELSHVYVGILNDYDLIASKLFRGSTIDIEDCLALVKVRKEAFDIGYFENHYRELAKYDISEDRILVHLENFTNLLRKENLYG